MQSEVCIVRNMIVFFQLYIQYILLQASLEKLTFDIDLMDKKIFKLNLQMLLCEPTNEWVNPLYQLHS